MIKKQKGKLLTTIMFVFIMSFSVIISNVFFESQRTVEAAAVTSLSEPVDENLYDLNIAPQDQWDYDRYVDNHYYEEWRLDAKAETETYAGSNRLTNLTITKQVNNGEIEDCTEYDYNSYSRIGTFVENLDTTKVNNSGLVDIAIYERYNRDDGYHGDITLYTLKYEVKDGYELVGFRFYSGTSDAVKKENQLFDDITGNLLFNPAYDDPKVDENGNIVEYNKYNNSTYENVKEYYKTADMYNDYDSEGYHTLYTDNTGTLYRRFDPNKGVINQNSTGVTSLQEQFDEVDVLTDTNVKIYIVPVCRLLKYNVGSNFDYYEKNGTETIDDDRNWVRLTNDFNVRSASSLDSSEVNQKLTPKGIKNQDFRMWVLKLPYADSVFSNSLSNVYSTAGGIKYDTIQYTLLSAITPTEESATEWSNIKYVKLTGVSNDEQNFELIFSIDIKTSTIGVTESSVYYGIENVRGHWLNNTSDTRKSLNFDYSDSAQEPDPLIRAVWNYDFKTVIDNSVNEYNNENVKIPSGKSKSDYVGVFHDADEDSEAFTATFRINGKDDGNYPLFSGQESAFYKRDEDLGSKAPKVSNASTTTKRSYYIYNYGYQISGWTISFKAGSDKYISLDSLDSEGKVSVSSESSKMEIIKEDGTKNEAFPTCEVTSSIAQTLFGYFIDGYNPNSVALTLTPSWKAATITDGGSGTLDGDVEFNNRYLTAGDAAELGQELFAFKSTKGSERILVAESDGSIPWNYVNIKYDHFTYEYESGKYKIELEEVYKNNVYVVGLRDNENDVSKLKDVDDNFKIVSEDSDYAYNASTYAETSLGNVYTIHTLGGFLGAGFESYKDNGYNPENLSDLPSAVDYVIKLATIEEWYNDKVEDVDSTEKIDKLYIFNNVYLSNDNLYIFLINGKNPGKLPVFELAGYDSIIYWHSNDYAYITNTFKFGINDHGDYEPAYTDDTSTEGAINSQTWYYSQMIEMTDIPISDKVNLQVGLFRPYYEVNLNTIRTETDVAGRYGYIYVSIADNYTGSSSSIDGAASFIAVFDKTDGGMRFYEAESLEGLEGKEQYKLNGDYNENSSLLTDDKYDIALNYDDDPANPTFRLYAGCDLTLKMGCVDYLIEQYDDMIGYRFVQSTIGLVTVSNADISDWVSGITNATEKTIRAEEIQQDNLDIADKITINAVFEPIKYVISAEIDDGYAGVIDIDSNKAYTLLGQNSIKLTNNNLDASITYLTVESPSKTITYDANAGFTLENDAFTFNGITLQSYNGNESEQTLSLIFKGTWLRENYYNATVSHDYINDETQPIENIKISTENYDFTVKVEVIDEDGNPIDTIDKTADINYLFRMTGADNTEKFGGFSINGTGIDSLFKSEVEGGTGFSGLNNKWLANFLTYYDDTLFIYEYDSIKYAPVKAWLSNYSDLSLSLDFYWQETTNEKKVDIKYAAANENFIAGPILASEQRVMTVKLQVSKLITVNVYEMNTEYSNPYGDRGITFKSNHVNIDYINKPTVALGNSVDENVSVLTGYTYIYKSGEYSGLENQIYVYFDQDRYSTAELYWRNEDGELTIIDIDDSKTNSVSSTFILTSNEDRNIVVKFIPKPITNLEVEYYCDGVKLTSQEEIESYITADLDNPPAGVSLEFNSGKTKAVNLALYVNESVTLKFTTVNSNYMAIVKVNGVEAVNPNAPVCTVNDLAYQKGGFNVVVYLEKIPTEAALIKFVSEGISSETYLGTFEVYIMNSNDTTSEGQLLNYVAQTSNGYYNFPVPEGKRVEIKLVDIAAGFKFESLKQLTTVVSTSVDHDNRVLLSNNFIHGRSSGYYAINLAKEKVNAKLTVDTTATKYANEYSMTSFGITPSIVNDGTSRLTNLEVAVGKTLTFSKVDNQDERLYRYFYVDKDGNRIYDGFDASGVRSVAFNITSDVLNNVNSNVVNGENVWNINFGVEITKKYALSYSVAGAANAERVSIKYTDDDNSTPANYISGTKLVNGTIYLDILPKSENGSFKYDVKLIGLDGIIDGAVYDGKDEVNTNFALNGNYSLYIQIIEKSYNINYSEYVYTSLEQLENGEPLMVSENQIGADYICTSRTYNYYTTIKIDLHDTEQKLGQLYTIEVTGNDLGTYEKNGETTDVKIVITLDNDYNVTMTKIGLVEESVTDYVTSVDRKNGQISVKFVVKNNINIKTAYKSYVSIMPASI